MKDKTQQKFNKKIINPKKSTGKLNVKSPKTTTAHFKPHKNNTLSLKQKGLIKENIVAKYLKNRGWEIVFQNKKILGVEVDLFVKKNKNYCLIEVKSLKTDQHLQGLFKDKQKERLKKVGQSLLQDYPKGLRFFLASVDPKNKIDFFEVFY